MEVPEPIPTVLSSPHSTIHRNLLLAGPHLRPLKQIHARLIVSGLHGSRALLTKLLALICSAGGSTDYSHRLLFSVPNPDAFLFNSIIKASSKSGFSSDAISFYRRMLLLRLPPSNFTFTPVIKACANLSALEIGRIVHSHSVACGFDLDCFVQAAFVTLYAKGGDLGTAQKVFDRMPERTVVAWNAMISGYEQNGLCEEAVELFYQMQDARIEPDSATLVLA